MAARSGVRRSSLPRDSRPVRRGQSEVLFFLSLLIFLALTLGAVIVAQKVTISYLTREFPRVAEHNFRALQASVGALDARLTEQLQELRRACVLERADGLLPPPAPGAFDQLAPKAGGY